MPVHRRRRGGLLTWGGVTEAHWSHMFAVTFLYLNEQPFAAVHVAVQTARLGATC